MIRTYQSQDARRIQAIALECFDHNLKKDKNLFLARFFIKRYFRQKNIESRLKENYELYVYLHQDMIIGFIEIHNADEISNIFIDPRAQKHGAGTKLIEYAIERCQQIDPNVERVWLDASIEAVGFYEHCGFNNLSRLKKVLGVETYMMEKKLKNN